MFKIESAWILWFEGWIVKEYMHLAPISIWNTHWIGILRALDIRLKGSAHIIGKWAD
jgi:hypothetical protein